MALHFHNFISNDSWKEVQTLFSSLHLEDQQKYFSKLIQISASNSKVKGFFRRFKSSDRVMEGDEPSDFDSFLHTYMSLLLGFLNWIASVQKQEVRIENESLSECHRGLIKKLNFEDFDQFLKHIICEHQQAFQHFKQLLFQSKQFLLKQSQFKKLKVFALNQVKSHITTLKIEIENAEAKKKNYLHLTSPQRLALNYFHQFAKNFSQNFRVFQEQKLDSYHLMKHSISFEKFLCFDMNIFQAVLKGRPSFKQFI